MKNICKKLFLIFVMALGIIGGSSISDEIIANAATYPSPSVTYNIYDLVRDASKSDNCTKMVPQGITFAGEYLLISACCEEETKHNSVIYVFDESTKSYYGTIKLPSTAHAGGVAYDCDRDGNIWVANGTSVGCFKYSKLADCKGKVLSVAYNRVAELSYQASTMCYDAVNDCLWIAQFDETDSSNSFARCYKVNDKTTNTPKLPYQFQISVPLKTQGISVRGDKMMISSSYGRTKDSALYLYTWNQSSKQKTPIKDKNNNIKSITLPPLSEGVVMGSTYAYVVYESVSAQYYATKDKNGNKCSYPVEYFAAYDIANLYKQLES
ncbi:hypothetical protein [Clostridium saccharoperbutylacetonicum]